MPEKAFDSTPTWIKENLMKVDGHGQAKILTPQETSWKTKLKHLPCKGFSFRYKIYLFLIILFQIQKSCPELIKIFGQKYQFL
jgi:hypothetical protein